MTEYAIGDIQGCYGALMQLLDKLHFDPAKDKIWLAGDIVSRGEDSLAVLRLVKSMNSSVKCVLGNHDISLIAMHHGLLKPHRSLKKILKSPDREELISWLSAQPLIQVDKSRKICMTHAGLPPQWKVKAAIKYADEIQQNLQSDEVSVWLKNVYGNTPEKWKKSLTGYDRHRYILNAFTRMRFLRSNGSLTFTNKQSPKAQKKYKPWFEHAKRKNSNYCILFGHWASLGFYQGNNVIGLDSGCVWGNRLSAVKLDDINKKTTSNSSTQAISVSCKKVNIGGKHV